MKRGADKKYDSAITFVLTKELHEKIIESAKEKEIPLNALIRIALKEYLEKK